jgi:predicted kinase
MTTTREGDLPRNVLLVLCVGLPRSGKSTWARAQGVPVVNPDSIRLALHGQRYVARAEPIVWATAKLMVHALFLAGHDTVILDATCLSRARRAEWRSTEWSLGYKVFDTSHEECHRRAALTRDTEIMAVIDRMWAGAEWPTRDEQPYVLIGARVTDVQAVP